MALCPEHSQQCGPPIPTEPDFAEIRGLFGQMSRLAVDALAIYVPIVDEIIGSKCRDSNRIDHALDSILGFCFDQRMVEQFRKLCRYYYRFNPQAAAEYVLLYREMWDEEPEPPGTGSGDT